MLKRQSGFRQMIRRDRLIVQSNICVLTQVQEWFDQFCARYTTQLFWLKPQLYPLSLALTEGFSNAVRHAHHDLPIETAIEIDLALWDDRFEIRIWDHGKPFDPNQLEEPKPGTLRQGGYGWFLLRRLADQVLYERDGDERNCLLIVKYRATPARSPACATG
ncbi:anti-sigma regulatory factor [Microcoleus sp. FACHB-1515]|uniref:ATP-binding protein n=1 Tax=Cyanophyceae TaxID=3028117 RepID=UPI001F55573D|nr:anti-sigma regulatory factor [Microcoleus sp. FACHB-1515]